jgi:hypothetical protein
MEMSESKIAADVAENVFARIKPDLSMIPVGRASLTVKVCAGSYRRRGLIAGSSFGNVPSALLSHGCQSDAGPAQLQRHVLEASVRPITF